MFGLKKCDGCGKMRWRVNNTAIILGQKATVDKKQICRKCAKKLAKI